MHVRDRGHIRTQKHIKMKPSKIHYNAVKTKELLNRSFTSLLHFQHAKSQQKISIFALRSLHELQNLMHDYTKQQSQKKTQLSSFNSYFAKQKKRILKKKSIQQFAKITKAGKKKKEILNFCKEKILKRIAWIRKWKSDIDAIP